MWGFGLGSLVRRNGRTGRTGLAWKWPTGICRPLTIGFCRSTGITSACWLFNLIFFLSLSLLQHYPSHLIGNFSFFLLFLLVSSFLLHFSIQTYAYLPPTACHSCVENFQITVTVFVGGLQADYSQSKLLLPWSIGLESGFTQSIYWTRPSGHYRGLDGLAVCEHCISWTECHEASAGCSGTSPRLTLNTVVCAYSKFIDHASNTILE